MQVCQVDCLRGGCGGLLGDRRRLRLRRLGVGLLPEEDLVREARRALPRRFGRLLLAPSCISVDEERQQTQHTQLNYKHSI